MDGRGLDCEPAGLGPIAVRTVPAGALDRIDDPNVCDSELAVVLDLLLHLGMTVFRREHLDSDELGLTEDGTNRNLATPDAYIGDSDSVGAEKSALFLDRARPPLFVMAPEPVENRPLHKVVLVFAHASLLDFALDELRVGLVLGLQILAESNAYCGGHTPVLCFGVYTGFRFASRGRRGASAAPEPEVGGDKAEEHHGDDAIHGEEGSVETAQVAGGDDGVLVAEQQSDGADTDPTGGAEVEEQAEPEEQAEHGEMHEPGDPEGSANADGLGKAIEAGGAVVVNILAGIENVEACDPEGDGAGEDEDASIEGATDGDPGGGGSDAESETENEVGVAREALHVAIAEEHEERDGREPQRERVELEGSEDKGDSGEDGESENELPGEMAGRDGAGAGAGIGGVELGVGPAIEGHG